MLESNDGIKLLQLTSAIAIFSNKHKIKFKHVPTIKHTESLYRYGIFEFDGQEYSISAWKFITDVVTFENEKTQKKIKFSIKTREVIYGEFERTSFIEKNVKYIRNTLSIWLKDLSDKLHT